MSELGERLGLRVVGHVLIKDRETGEVIRDVFNAIHRENMSEALALALGDRPHGHVQSMVFGNGGSIVSAVGNINYLPPNVDGADSNLYNQTFSKVVNDQSPLDQDPVNNKIRVNHALNTFYSDVQITCTLNYNEPSGQGAFDDAPVVNASAALLSGTAMDNNGMYIFDELGLKTFDPLTGKTKLLSHVIFHPVQKALNRAIEIIYTIRIIID